MNISCLEPQPGVLQHHFDLDLLAPGVAPSAGSARSADPADVAGHGELQRINETRYGFGSRGGMWRLGMKSISMSLIFDAIVFS